MEKVTQNKDIRNRYDEWKKNRTTGGAIHRKLQGDLSKKRVRVPNRHPAVTYVMALDSMAEIIVHGNFPFDEDGYVDGCINTLSKIYGVQTEEVRADLETYIKMHRKE